MLLSVQVIVAKHFQFGDMRVGKGYIFRREMKRKTLLQRRCPRGSAGGLDGPKNWHPVYCFARLRTAYILRVYRINYLFMLIGKSFAIII